MDNDHMSRAKVRRICNAAISKASRKHGVSIADILSRKRTPHIAHCRQDAMRYARKRGISYPNIGLHMDRDHTTVMHGVKRSKARKKANKERKC